MSLVDERRKGNLSLVLKDRFDFPDSSGLFPHLQLIRYQPTTSYNTIKTVKNTQSFHTRAVAGKVVVLCLLRLPALVSVTYMAILPWTRGLTSGPC